MVDVRDGVEGLKADGGSKAGEARKARVLAVDDTPATRYALVRVLRHAGFDVIEADTGNAALRLAPESDVVCLDVQLPDISGFEVCSRLKADPKTSSIPIVHVTASYADDLSMARGLEGGADAYLTLPIEPHVLIATLHALLRLRSTEHELQKTLESEVAARRAAEESRSWLEFLARATTSLVTSLDHDTTMATAVQVAVPEFADASVLWVADDGVLRRAGAHASRPALAEGLPATLPRDADGPGPGQALATGEPLRVEALATSVLAPALHDYQRALLEAGVTSVIWAPLAAAGQVFGVMSFLRTGAREPFRETDALVASQLAGRSAIAFENSRLYSELRRSDRAKEEFLSMLAHELRNPLEPILTAAHVLGREEVDVKAKERARAIVLRQARHMARLVDDLLDISRVNTGKIELRKERIELNALVRDTAEDYRGQMEAQGLALELRLAANLVPLHADSARLRQALGNFLHNAAKFTPAGGRVVVETHVEGENAVFSVKDTGIGMSDQTLRTLFTPFVQADRSFDRSRGGLGLGLTVARGLIALSGGTIHVTSPGLGAGSEVKVSLPLDRAPRPAAAPRTERCKPEPMRILIAEDSWDAASALRDFLELGGHTVAVEGTGTAAVDTARTFCPDVVLCDLGLPEMDGYEVARILKSDPLTARARLIAISGYAQAEDRRHSADAGFERHLAKPVDPKDLEAILVETFRT